MRRQALMGALTLGLALGACAGPSPSATPAASQPHDPQAERVKAALSAEVGMSFETAGPHHELGKAPDGV